MRGARGGIWFKGRMIMARVVGQVHRAKNNVGWSKWPWRRGVGGRNVGFGDEGDIFLEEGVEGDLVYGDREAP